MTSLGVANASVAPIIGVGEGAHRRIMSRAQIQAQIIALAALIDGQRPSLTGVGEELVLVGVLDAGLYFTADLSRELFTPNHALMVGFHTHDPASNERVAISAVPTLTTDLLFAERVAGHDVVIVDTICDTGVTMGALTAIIGGYHPARLETCALVWRKSGGAPKPTYVGVAYEGEEFLFGYGLDNYGYRRHIPYLGAAIHSD